MKRNILFRNYLIFLEEYFPPNVIKKAIEDHDKKYFELK